MARPLMTYELRHLRYFLAAVEHGSFRRAGVVLGVQESSISRRIRDLEDHLGASLFQRYNGGVRLTVAGERFETRARAIIGQVSDSAVDVSVIGRGRDGRIRIGLVAPLANGFLADILREFTTSHQGVYIELIDGGQTAHVNAIQHFDLDMAFPMGARPWCGCDVAQLSCERLFVLLAEDHHLSHHTELSWEDLVSETFMIAGTPLGNELRALLTSRLADLGHAPFVQAQNAGCDNLLPLVALGRGVMLSVRPTTEPGIIHRPISDETIPFAAVWSPKNDNPAFRRFLSMARARARFNVTGSTAASP